MAREAKRLSDRPGDERREGKVIPLGKEPIRTPVPPPSKPRGLHALATAGTALFAVVAALSALLFITVRWPGDSGRKVIGVMLFSLLGLSVSVAIGMFSAARITFGGYRGGPSGEAEDTSGDAPE